MILSVELENWKSHSKTKLEFSRGTNVLLGRMGAGKSSVLDAICFALYGTFPKMSRRDTTTESLVNFSSGAENATVKVEFDKSGEKYLVERKIGKKISEAEIRKDGKLVQKGAKAVTDHVISILGVDYDLFTRAIYSEQNKIDYLLSLNPRARKGEIDWLLGLGQFDEAREAASSVANKLSEQSQLFESEATPEKIQLQNKKIWELEGQVGEAEAKAAKLQVEEAAAAKHEEERKASLALLEKSRADYQSAKAECDRASAILERAKKECEGKERPDKNAIDEAELLMNQSSEAERREAGIGRESQTKLTAATSALAVAENSLKSALQSSKRKSELESRLKSLTAGKMVETLSKELSEEKSELESLLEVHAGLHAQSDELSSSIAALSSTGAKCPICDSDLSGGKAERIAGEKRKRLDEGEKLAAEHLKEIEEKKKKVALLEKNLSEASACLSELSSPAMKAADAAALEREIAALAKEVAALRAKLSEAEEKAKEFRKQTDSLRLKLEGLKRAHELFARLDEARARDEAAQKKLSGMAFDESSYEKARAGFESARVHRARLAAELEGEKRQLGLLSQMLQSERKLGEELGAKKGIADKYRLAAESMMVYKNALASAQSELRSTLVEEINSALSEIWPSVYPYSDYGGVKIEANEKDYLVLMEKAGWQEVDSVASGGERACLCLALRVAFAAVLTPDLGWLILDEPTHNLDSEAVSLLSEAINSKIPSIVEQTFVITHDLALGENSDCRIYRLERDKGRGQSTEVAAP